MGLLCREDPHIYAENTNPAGVSSDRAPYLVADEIPAKNSLFGA